MREDEDEVLRDIIKEVSNEQFESEYDDMYEVGRRAIDWAFEEAKALVRENISDFTDAIFEELR